ncbi:MAG: hypothetical protein MUP58_02815 [Candidatus Nanohaloarchaeota archaeon QJJ-9]|nr:hypothetical protein [Candidatus Nanohaloarchaeota archaeon QJJ-9]
MDRKNFAILKVVQDSEIPAWKTRIYREISNQIEKIPVDRPFSIQTVCRRVDELYSQGKIDRDIKNLEQVNRSLIKTYHLTEEGRKALERVRTEILREELVKRVHALIGYREDEPKNSELVKELFCNRFGVPRKEIDSYPCQHIVPTILSYYGKDFFEQYREEYTAFISELKQYNQQLAAPAEKYTTE